MIFRYLSLCAFVLAGSFSLANGQTPSKSSFLQKLENARPISGITLTGTAEWWAGSQHENGDATLHAGADGSTSVQLSLDHASRTETQSRLDEFRSCQWTDSTGTVHDVLGPNCFVAVPWFAPGLYAQPSAQLPAMLVMSDGGEVSSKQEAATVHQISYALNIRGKTTASTKRLANTSRVKVFYDPQALLPTSLEYSIYSDSDDAQALDVRVVFSDYRTVAGVQLPFHIERFVNRSLQLKLDISNASIE